jgi:hypothetical protein
MSSFVLTDLFLFFLFTNAEQVSLKRLPRQPKLGYFLARGEGPETIQPTPYVDLV